MLRIMLAFALFIGLSAPALAAKHFPYGYPTTICPIVQSATPGPSTANCTETTDSWWEARAEDNALLPVLAAADNGYDIRTALGVWFVNKYPTRCVGGKISPNGCFAHLYSDVIYVQSSNAGCGGISPYTVITGSGSTNYNDNAPYSISLSSTTMELVIGRIRPLNFNPMPPGQSCSGSNRKKLEIFPLDQSSSGNAFARLSAKCASGEHLQSYPYNWDPYQTGEVIFWCNDVPGSTYPLDSVSGLDSDRQGCTYGCNPVDLVTGAKLDYVVDYKNHSPFPIVWDRRYDSRLGIWIFNYSRKIGSTLLVSGRPLDATIKRPDGSLLRFTRPNPTSIWVADDIKALGSLTSQATLGGETFEYTNLLNQIEKYDEAGNLAELRNSIGQKLTFQYHTSGDLQRIEDDFGRYLDVRMTPSTAGSNPISVTDGDKTVQYTFTLSGSKKLLTNVIYPDGEDIDYIYDEGLVAGGGLLTGIVPEDEIRWGTYTYSSSNKVTSTSHGAGLDFTTYIMYPNTSVYVDWGSSSAWFSLSDPQVAATKKTKGSSTPCPNCGGASVSAINYNSQGVPTSYTGFDQVSVARTVDTRGLTLTETVAPGSTLAKTTTYTWESNARIPSTISEEIDVDGVPETRLTTFTYDSNNRLTEATIDPSSAGATRTWSWTHNQKGQINTSSSPGTGTSTFTYDTQGNLETSQNSLLQTTTFSDYTPQGLVGTITDPNGLQTKMTYDDRERVIEMKQGTPGTHWETMSIEYELYGEISKITQPDGTWVEYSYDSAHRLVEVKDQRGKMVITLNNAGDVTKQESFAGSSTLVQTESYTYDTYRRLKKTIDAQNKETTLNYRGNSTTLLSESDPDGVTQQWSKNFDLLGQTAQINSHGISRVLIHDRNGEIVSSRDGNSVYTYFTYNGFGETVETASPDNGTSEMTYDVYGRISTSTDARGVVSTTTYDAGGRPIQVVYDGSSATPLAINETQSFTYDTCSNGVGRLCEISDHSGITSFTYDLWGRILNKTTTPTGGASSFALTTGYSYNNTGQLVATTYPSGKQVVITYDLGLPSTVEYNLQQIMSNITYQPFGTAVSGWDWDMFAGQVQFSYDLNGRINAIEDADERNYFRNAKGWILGIEDPGNSAADQLYTYNGVGNLTQANLAARPDPIDFILNENDGIQRKKTGPQWADEVYYDIYSNYTINNRILFVQVGLNPQNDWTYDASGNMLDNGAGLTMVYDAKNRPRTTSRLGIDASYSFNAMGQRIRKSGNHLSTGHRFYAYDEAGRVLGEYDGHGNALEEYVYLDGFRPVALVRNIGLVSDIYPILTDHLGTPRKVLDSSGAPQWTWDAKDPYGHQMPDQLAGGSTFVFDLRFPGQRYDSETGLYHNGFRDYNPATGTYVQPDPIGLAGGWNPYAYVGANPINHTDPHGLIVEYEGTSSAQARQIISNGRKLSSHLNNLMTVIELSPETYTVNADTINKNQYNTINNRLTWNPLFRGECINTNPLEIFNTPWIKLTPYDGLFHEVGHAYRDEKRRKNKQKTPGAAHEETENLVHERIIINQISNGKRRGRNNYVEYLLGRERRSE